MTYARALATVTTAAALLLAPPAFGSGTVAVSGGVLHYATTSATAERVDFSIQADGSALVSAADGITAGTGCTADLGDFRLAHCTGVTAATADLGPGGDTVAGASAVALTVHGAAGDDTVQLTSAPLTFDGGAGADRLFLANLAAPPPFSFAGGPGRDVVDFSQRTAALTISLDNAPNDGGPGEAANVHSDVEAVVGGHADDTITGGPGDDELNGGDGRDTVSGGNGNDRIDGDANSACTRETLDGGPGNDTLVMRGDTAATGGDGDDRFTPIAVQCSTGDVAQGGPGTDTADFSTLIADAVWISLDGIPDDGPDGDDDYDDDIENATAGARGAVLIGNDAANVLRGGAGSDLLDGAGGADTLSGGGDEDVADYSERTGPVSLTLDGQANDGASGEHDLIGTDVEDLIGGDGNDLLSGDDHANAMDGGPGADTMRGGAGFDAVDYSLRDTPVIADLDGVADDGSPGENDAIATDVEGLFGGAGNDVLTGGSHDDGLFGGDGSDLLTGGGGADYHEGDDGDDAIDSADDVKDAVICGLGEDVVRRDALDTIVGDCERVTVATATPPPPPPPAQTPPPPPPVPKPDVKPIDRVSPRATLSAPSRQQSR